MLQKCHIIVYALYIHDQQVSFTKQCYCTSNINDKVISDCLPDRSTLLQACIWCFKGSSSTVADFSCQFFNCFLVIILTPYCNMVGDKMDTSVFLILESISLHTSYVIFEDTLLTII